MLHFFDKIPDFENLNLYSEIIKKIDKCNSAVSNGHNLADIIHDHENKASLIKLVGEKNISDFIRLIIKYVLKDYSSKSFNIFGSIKNQNDFLVLYRTFGGWKQFDTCILINFNNKNSADQPLYILNPRRNEQWKKISSILEGSLIEIFVKTIGNKRIFLHEIAALEKYKNVFNSIHYVSPIREPVVRQKKPTRSSDTKAPKVTITKANYIKDLVLTESCEIIINKIDTFVHAGNAQLIVDHLKEHRGRVKMYVLRDKKKEVNLNVDSIWSEEIRNGEKIIFDFYNFSPKKEYIEQLAKKINKYTQMDKIF